jgi:Fe(3+) dicitrate transport protein
MAFKRFIFFLLLPVTIYGQSKDTVSIILDEIEVKEEKLEARTALKSVDGMSIYSGKKTEVVSLDQLVLNKGANTTRQLFAGITGLTIFENDDAGLQLSVGSRGLDPNRSSNFNTRQNGYDISADPLGYPESYYTPTSDGIERIEVIRGAASLQYGSQFGGLLNFRMKGPEKDALWAIENSSTMGSYGLRTNFTSATLRKGAVSAYGYFNNRKSQGFRPNSAFNANHSFVQMNFTLNEAHKFTFEHTYLYYLAQQPGGLTDDLLKNDPFFSNRSRNFFRVNWNLLHGNWTFSPNAKTTIKVSATALGANRFSLGFRGIPSMINLNPIITVDEQNADGSFVYERDLIAGQFSNQTAEAKVLRRYRYFDQPRVLLFGIKAFQSLNLSEQGPGSKGKNADFSFRWQEYSDYPNQSSFTFPNLNLAAFMEHIFILENGWSITPGMRLEHIRTEAQGFYTNIIFDNAGNVIDRKELNDNFNFSRGFALVGIGISKKEMNNERYFNWSQNYRSVTFADIRTVNPTFIIDPEIKDERGWTSDWGTRGNKGPWGYDANLFTLYYANRIGIVFNNRAQRVRKNIGSALMYGVESFISYDLTFNRQSRWEIDLWTNTAITGSNYIQSDVPNVRGKHVEFVPLLNLKTGATVKSEKWRFNIQVSALTKQFTDVENSEVGQPGNLRDGILGPIPAYSVIDFSGVFTPKWGAIDYGVNNLFNSIYFTRRALGYPGPGIIPSAPRNIYLGLRIKLDDKTIRYLKNN